jgi:predicted deacylase
MIRLRALALLMPAALLPALAVAQRMETPSVFTVGSATASPGAKAYGAIVVPAGVDSGLTIPVAVINGTRPGPVVALVAGSHGTEYASIVALTRIIERIPAAFLAGAVIVAPLLNVASFERMIVHVNPVDGKGMNAQYPGDPRGTQSQRALALVADQIVRPADVIIDLHGGDMDEELRPYSYWIRTGDAQQDSASRALAMAFGLNHIIVRDINLENPAMIRSLSGYALSQGKVSFVAEAGHAGMVEPRDVDALIEGTLDALGSLKMLRRPAKPRLKPVWLMSDARVRADSSVMFYPTVLRGARVTKGMRVGRTTDYLGRPLGDVLAPASGMVTFIRGVPSAPRGGTLVTVIPVLETLPGYVKP